MNGGVSGPEVAIVSVMGIEFSGLVIAAKRYSDALKGHGWLATPIVVSRETHLEHQGMRAVGDLTALARTLRDRSRNFRAVLWVGLHVEDWAFKEQINVMEELAAIGCLNFVLPERTERPGRESYSNFEARATSSAMIAGLLHLNAHESAKWREVIKVESVEAPAPIPEELFRLGERREASASSANAEFGLVVMGRLTRRKGADVLVREWTT